MSRFLVYLVTHMYVANPQARPGALESMDLACMSDLREKGVVTTSRFKTAETYGYQTIVVGPATLKLLEYWVQCFRPTIAGPHSGTRLFLTSTGNPHASLGKLVTEFFRSWDLHITTNAIRSGCFTVNNMFVISNICLDAYRKQRARPLTNMMLSLQKSEQL